MFACNVNEYSPDGTSFDEGCQLCPAGYRCPNPSATPVMCDIGWYSEEGDTDCIICPPGSYCFSVTQTPVACDDGWYSKAGQG